MMQMRRIFWRERKGVQSLQTPSEPPQTNRPDEGRGLPDCSGVWVETGREDAEEMQFDFCGVPTTD